MIFTETKLKGAFIIDLELVKDDRGFFARTWCKKEFSKYGLNPNLVQCSTSLNLKKGTIRGMHFQLFPYEEAKLVRCTRGSMFDVIIDLRPTSKTFKEWVNYELTSENRKMIYIPEGFAHGFQTLEDNTEVLYHMSEYHLPEYATGVRWNDPAFNINWPQKNNIVISEKDKSYPDFKG